MTYRLSIIIPHYNSIELLNKLLETIPDNENIQVIVVDDHSSDDVKKEYIQLCDKYPSRYSFLENKSPVHNAGAARNIGLKNAEGDWLLFADSDDYFLDGFYDVVSKYFDSDYDLVYFEPTSINLDTGQLGQRHLTWKKHINNYIFKPSRKTEIRLRTRLSAPFSKIIRSSLVREHDIRFDEISVSNDQFFSTKVGFYAKKVAASNSVIYCITRNSGSLTTHVNLNTFEMRTSTLIRVTCFLRNNMSRKDFYTIGRFPAYDCLFSIIRNRYGIKIFIKYVKLFRKNHMYGLSWRSFSLDMFGIFYQEIIDERRIKNKYQVGK